MMAYCKPSHIINHVVEQKDTAKNKQKEVREKISHIDSFIISKVVRLCICVLVYVCKCKYMCASQS